MTITKSGQLKLLALALMLCCGLMGCRSLPTESSELAAPLEPLAKGQVCGVSSADCMIKRTPSTGRSEAIELILTYVGTGRDFTEPGVPEGFVLRVIPLSDTARPAPLQADLIIALFKPGSDGKGEWSVPLLCWRVSRDNLAHYWVRSRLLDGYLFRLAWGAEPVAPGEYVLFVQESRPAGTATLAPLCQKIRFENRTDS